VRPENTISLSGLPNKEISQQSNDKDKTVSIEVSWGGDWLENAKSYELCQNARRDEGNQN